MPICRPRREEGGSWTGRDSNQKLRFEVDVVADIYLAVISVVSTNGNRLYNITLWKLRSLSGRETELDGHV